MLIFYRNSVLASIYSIFGSVLVLGGILIAVEDGDVTNGILMAVMGVPLLILAKHTSKNKAFKKWWKQVEDNGLIPRMLRPWMWRCRSITRTPRSEP